MQYIYDMQEILSYSLFNVGENSFTTGHAILFLVISLAIVVIYRTLLKKYFPKIFDSSDISSQEMKKLVSILRWLAFFTIGLISVSILKLDVLFYDCLLYTSDAAEKRIV